MILKLLYQINYSYFLFNKSFPMILIIKPIGVIIRKKMVTITDDSITDTNFNLFINFKF